MKKLAVLFIVLGSLYLGFQAYTMKVMGHITFQVTPSPTSPASIRLSYQEMTLTQPGRVVKAWFIGATGDTRTNMVVVLFNGRGDNLSEWIYFQQYLARNGIASVCFDYGPQADTLQKQGSSRLDEVTDDVKAILDILQLTHRKPLNVFLLAHSVGNAVMLQLYPAINSPFIKGIIICNAFASMKQWSIQHGPLQPLVAAFFPAYYDNVANVKRVTQPIIILHSRQDRVNLFSDAKELYSAIKSPKEFIAFDHFSHNDMYKKGNVTFWSPIVRFVKTQSTNPISHVP